MLSDLIQYFTNEITLANADEEIDYTEDRYETLRFLRFAVLYAYDDNDRFNLLHRIGMYSENIRDLYSVFDMAYSSNYHLCDWFIHKNYTNAIWELIMMTILKSGHFDIDFASSNILDIFEGKPDNIKKIPEWSSTIDRKISHKINSFIKDVISNLIITYSDGDGKQIDEYDAEVTYVQIGTIKFKKWNKGVARKLRKAYANNCLIKAMFNALDIYMINGELVMMMGYYADGYDPSYEIRETDTIFEGLDELMRYFGRTPVEEEWQIKTTFEECVYAIDGEDGNWTNQGIISDIMKIKNGNKEVIL